MDAASHYAKAPIFRLNMIRALKRKDYSGANYWARKVAEAEGLAFNELGNVYSA